MSRAKGYSIWLIPDGKARDILNSIINKFSKKYNSPYFQPHVTLIGEIEESENLIIEKACLLAQELYEFEIKLESYGQTEDYFRSLFLEAHKGRFILEANNKAREIFKVADKQQFLPHLSLIYGNLSNEAKEGMISEIKDSLPISFNVNKLHITSTLGEPKDWRIIKEISFS